MSRVSTAGVLLLVGGLALLFSLPFITQLQADTYKALYDGRWIVAHGLPHHEALTVMARGRSWIDEQWLAEVLFYKAWRLGGYSAVAILAGAAIALAYVMLAALMLRRGASIALTLACSLLAILTLTGWQFVRSQDLALPLFAAVLGICLTDRASERPGLRLLLLPPVLVLWSNLHGSVLLGAALATAYLILRCIESTRAGRRADALFVGGLAVATVLTPLATPYGLDIVHYYREFAGNAAMARLAGEWSSPRFPSFVFFEFVVPASLTTAAVLRTLRRRRRPHPLLCVAAVATASAGALESGSIVWFGMVASLLLADTLASASRTPLARRLIPTMGAAGIALTAIVVLQLTGRSDTQYEWLLPTRVVRASDAYAIAHPCTQILADNLTSSALLWHDSALAGRVAFDARLEQYPAAALSRWVDFLGGRSLALARSDGEDVIAGDTFYASGLSRELARLPVSTRLAIQANGIAVLHAGRTNRPCTRLRPGHAR